MSMTIEEQRREDKKRKKIERLAKKDELKAGNKNSKKKKKSGESLIDKTSRPLTENEYEQIMSCIRNGFIYEENGKTRKFRPNEQVFLALLISSNMGLRLGDVVFLRVGDIRNAHLKIVEQKTGKIQDREISKELYHYLMDYALDKGLRRDDLFITIGERAIQKQLKIVRDYLGLNKVSSHSFRKTYATRQYVQSGYNIKLVQKLLNHTKSDTTEIYIGVKQEEVNKASSSLVMGLDII